MNSHMDSGSIVPTKHNNTPCVFNLLHPHPHHQPVAQHADLQDASARSSLGAAREADGGLGGALRPRTLHLQPRPHHQQHPALALLREVRSMFSSSELKRNGSDITVLLELEEEVHEGGGMKRGGGGLTEDSCG